MWHQPQLHSINCQYTTYTSGLTGADPGFFRGGGGAPLRDGVTDW